MSRLVKRLLLGAACLLPVYALHARDLHVAVASNFVVVMRALADDFADLGGNTLVIASGSTGKHYAQIRQGAPFDAFFAADSERPKLLESDGIAVAGSRMTYAFGRLVLWSKQNQPAYMQALTDSHLRRLAIANPRFAPYGLAAQQVLTALGIFATVEKKLVFGENIAQTYQFVASGNASMGFIAWSQWQQTQEGFHWLVPAALHQPIAQQMVLIDDSQMAWHLRDYISGQRAQSIIRQAGYETQ